MVLTLQRCYYQDVNNILNTGSVPNLFPADEVEPYALPTPSTVLTYALSSTGTLCVCTERTVPVSSPVPVRSVVLPVL